MSPELTVRIFDAAIAEFVASGADKFSTEAVARRVGVDAAVIYARWRDSRVLLMDAMLTRADQLRPNLDTGSLSGDLEAVAASAAAMADNDLGRQWFHRLLPTGRDVDLSEVGGDFWAAGLGSLEPVLKRAAKNDELRPGVDPREAIRMLTAALFYDVIFTDAPVRPEYAAQVREIFLYGILGGETHDAALRRDFEARERARALLRATTDAMLDPQALLEAVRDDDAHVVDFTFSEVNPAACDYLQRRREDLLGASLIETLPGFDVSGLLARYAHCVNTGEPLIAEDLPYYNRRHQQVRHYDMRAARASSDWLSVTWRDVTETYQANRRVWESEDRYRLLAENAWDVIWTMALDGTITYVSPSVERVRGITPQEAMTQPLEEIQPPESAARVNGYYADLFAAIANGTELPVFRGEQEYYRKDGSIMTGDLEVIPRLNADGEVTEILGVTRDISDRKRFEASEARYRELIENSIVATSMTTPDGRYAMVNPALCDWLGYDEATLLTKTWQEVTVTVDTRSRAMSVSEAAADGQPGELGRAADLLAGRAHTYQGERQFIHADGRLIWGYVSAFTLRDDNGEPKYLVGQIIDITREVESRR
jgi:PAS domain S-box-containing protein